MSSCDAVLKTPENGQEGIQRIACPLFGCKRVYSDRSSLESHVKDHDIPAQSLPGKVLLCSTVGCSGSFPDMQKLMEHMRHHHKPNIFFLCESCRTKLRSYRGLLTHLHTCSKVTRAKKKQNEPMPSPTVAAPNPNVVSPAVSTVNPPMNVVGAAMNVVNPPINIVSPAVNVINPPVNVVDPPVNMMNCPVTVMTPPVNMIPLPVNVTAESVNMAAVPMEVDASALDAAPAPQQLPSHPPNPDGPFPTMHPTDSAAPPNFAPLAPPQHFITPNMTEFAPQSQPQIGDQSFGQSPFPSAKDQMAAPDAPADQALHQLQTISPDPPRPAEDSAPQTPPGSVTAWKKNPGLTCTRRILWEHTKGRYTCVQCGHAVTNRKDMNHHIQTFHSGTKPADDNGGTV